jgi:hypothetical protein
VIIQALKASLGPPCCAVVIGTGSALPDTWTQFYTIGNIQGNAGVAAGTTTTAHLQSRNFKFT